MKEYKRYFIILVTLFILGCCSSMIFTFINKYIVTYIANNINWRSVISSLVVVVTVFFLAKIQIRLYKNGYRMSFNQKIVYTFLISMFLLARYEEFLGEWVKNLGVYPVKWQWIGFLSSLKVTDTYYSWIFEIKLIDFVWILLLYPILSLFKVVGRICWWIIPRVKLIFIVITTIIIKIKTSSLTFLKDHKVREWGKCIPLVKSFCIKSYKENLDVKLITKRDTNHNFFEEDLILEESNKTYSKLSEMISSKIINQKFVNAFSIGICGSWGSGKSSFIEHLLKDLDVQSINDNSRIVKI